MFYIRSLGEFCKSNAIDDARRNAGLTTPEDVVRYDDIHYGEDERHVLDVYRPRDAAGKLPVIVSIHGGGWVYGNKEIMQFYAMSLAQHGFAVVNCTYRLAPAHKHPAPLEDVNRVFNWVLDRAEDYGFDADNVFAVGDSIGANLVGLYCCLCTDSAYAWHMGITPPTGFLPRAVALNSGLYRLVRGEEDLLDSVAEAYFPGGGTDAEYADIDLGRRVTASFPPAFVMTAEQDFLMPQARPFYDRLTALGVPAEYRCYASDERDLTHVFHINIKLPEARQCNADECAFFAAHVRHDKLSQKERMARGLIYDTCDSEIMAMQGPLQEKLWAFNQLSPRDADKKAAYMKENFAECGEGCYVELPFRASWGGAHIHFGNGIYANTNVTFVDDGHIYVGNRVLIGPNVVITTANHPLNGELRKFEMQYNRDVHIGNNVWIGAGAMVLPGVHIGDNSVIAAGSVVTRDVPPNVLAMGAPCRPVRELGPREDEVYSRWGDKIDWENLTEICDRKRPLPKFN